jgi:DUF4097 and DUF4098 domain-containing protein YvlB
MLTGLVIGALSAAALLPQTDTIVQANGASRLELESFQGVVVVRTWDRDAVQIKADHSDSQSVQIHQHGTTISVEQEMEHGRGFGQAVDFEITIPRGFDLSIEGVALDVDIRGTEGQIEVTTVHGPISVQGGRESIILESVNGLIRVEDAQGDLEVTGIAGGVTIVNCTGDISAESVGGALTMEGINSADVEVGSVGGTLRYEGSIQDGGTYNFGSHGGEIWLYLPANINAQVDVLTLAGDIEVNYPGAPTEPTKGEGIPGLNQKELTFELGTGSARIEVETFGGTVHILRQGG